MNSPPGVCDAPNAKTGLILYSTAAAALVAVVLLTNWPTYNYSVRGGIAPLWYYALPVVLVIPILFAHPDLAFRYFKDPLVWWFVVFVLSGLMWLLLAQDFIEQASQQWRLRLLALGLFYSIAVLTTNVNRSFLAFVIVGCILIASAANWFDVLRPFRFIPQGMEGAHSGRGAGLFINPNVAGSFIAMATIVALPFIAMRLRAVVILIASIGIVPTFSRSGFLYAGLLLIAPIALRLMSRTQAIVLVVAVPLIIGITAASYDVLMSSSDDQQLNTTVRRLEWFKGGAEYETDEAAEGRLYGAQQAWRLFLEEPLTGRGIGITTMEVIVGEGPHNMYLLLMAEQGFLGLALYLSFIAVIARTGVRLVRTASNREGHDIGKAMILFAMFMFAYGFFSHNVFEEAQGMFVLAFLIASASAVARVSSWARPPRTELDRTTVGTRLSGRLGAHR